MTRAVRSVDSEYLPSQTVTWLHDSAWCSQVHLKATIVCSWQPVPSQTVTWLHDSAWCGKVHITSNMQLTYLLKQSQIDYSYSQCHWASLSLEPIILKMQPRTSEITKGLPFSGCSLPVDVGKPPILHLTSPTKDCPIKISPLSVHTHLKICTHKSFS